MTLKYCRINDYTPNNWSLLYQTLLCNRLRAGSRDIGYYSVGVYYYNKNNIKIEVI